MRCLTVDPTKRITWKAIDEHPLLMDNTRDSYIGTLRSKIRRANQPKPITAKQDPFELNKDAENLTISDDFDKIVDEVARKNKLDEKILQYIQMYLERRNIIMLTLKHGITPIYELQQVPVNHHLVAFLMCKKAYMEMSQLLRAIHARNNIFKLNEYWQEFTSCEQYSRLYDLLKADNDMIYNYASNFLKQAPPKNEGVKAELNLTNCTPQFIQICNEELITYSRQLFENRNLQGVNKAVLLKLIAFLGDLVRGIQMNSEQYNKAVEALDIIKFEEMYFKSMQTSYNGQKF